MCPDVLIADRTQSLRRSSTSSVEANVAFNGFYYDEEVSLSFLPANISIVIN